MSPISFDDVDKLIVDRWQEVAELVQAHEAVRVKLSQQLDGVAEALRAWAADQDLTLEVKTRDGEFWAYQQDWMRSDKSGPWAWLAVGGFTIDNAVDDKDGRLYACVYCSGTRQHFNKRAFGDSLRAALGPRSTEWEQDTDKSCPLNRYVPDPSARAVLFDSSLMSEIVKAQLGHLADLSEAITGAIQAATAAAKDRRA